MKIREGKKENIFAVRSKNHRGWNRKEREIERNRGKRGKIKRKKKEVHKK